VSETAPRRIRVALALACGMLLACTQAAAAAEREGLRDPLRPPMAGAEAPPGPDPADWRLSSTLIAEGRRVAIINGRVVGAGQTVDGARVLEVGPGRVRLRVGETRFTIRSTTPSVRSTPAKEAEQ